MMGPQQNTDPRYRSLVDPLTSDKRNRVIPAYGVRRKVIDLSNALNVVPLGLKGDVWYCDYNSTGVALAQLNNASEDPMPMLALAGLGNMPFDEFFITCAAQPGKFLNLWYGYGADFISPTSAIATIGSITNPVAISSIASPVSVDLRRWEYTPGVYYQDTTAFVANTAQNVLAAASNVNGVVVHQSQVLYSGAGGRISLLAKATAPASIVDGKVIHFAHSDAATSSENNFPLLREHLVDPALRLDYISNAAPSGAKLMHYTLR